MNQATEHLAGKCETEMNHKEGKQVVAYLFVLKNFVP